MKERPILFNAEMVRAILAGRKTQTRRMISSRTLDMFDAAASIGECYSLRDSSEISPNSLGYYLEFCPLGQPGDRLWVRETWAPESVDAEEGIYHPDYRATPNGQPTDERWRPSIHMPRWASRIDLLITGVRVERLQDISEEGAKAEGVTRIENNFGNGPAYCDYLLPDLKDTAEWYAHAKHSFQSLWRSIYGAESWQANPWVWVIEFQQIK